MHPKKKLSLWSSSIPSAASTEYEWTNTHSLSWQGRLKVSFGATKHLHEGDKANCIRHRSQPGILWLHHTLPFLEVVGWRLVWMQLNLSSRGIQAWNLGCMFPRNCYSQTASQPARRYQSWLRVTYLAVVRSVAPDSQNGLDASVDQVLQIDKQFTLRGNWK